MKRLIYTGLTLIIFSVVISSCKKEKNDAASLTKAWKVNDNKYNQLMSTGISPGTGFMLIATAEMPSGSNPVDVIQVYFKTRPVADGTYEIVYKETLGDLQDGETMVHIKEKSNDKETVAITEGNENKTITVKVESGKLNVTIPQLSALRGEDNGSKTESVTIEGNIVED